MTHGRADKQYCSERCGQIFRKRKYSLSRYNMTIEQYYDMLDAQNGTCAICRKPETAKKLMCVDHNHDTGAIRGLLCHRCNSGLGLFMDNPEALIAAASYVSAT